MFCVLYLDATVNEDVKFLYDDAADRMLIELLDFGINRTHVPTNFGEKSEHECTTFLKGNEYVLNNQNGQKCSIAVPKVTEEYETSYEMKNIFILPISLADEAYTCGEALVYRQFSDDLNLNIQRRDEYITFDNRKKDYDLTNARERYKMYKELEVHESELSNLKDAFESEKVLVDDPCVLPYNDSITKYRKMVRQQERDMKKVVEFLEKGVADLQLEQSVSFIKCHSGMWSSLNDDYNRSALHVFVEKGNIKCVESLLICGAHVNACEGCGVTPLMIALMQKNVDMTKLLLKYEARVWGLFPGHLPTPMEICEKLQHSELMEIITNVYKQDEMQSLAHAVEFLNTEEHACGLVDYDTFSGQTEASSSDSGESKTSTSRDNIITIGDVKTTVTTRGLKNRSPDEFGIFEETPGDFHALAYVMECLAKIFGTAGFYYTARQVLGRLKVTPNSFENMFKEENYERNYEALVDFYWGAGIAMVKKFEQSVFFPDRENLDKYESENGYANVLILARFKEWIIDQSSRDKTFEFFSSFVTEYGLLLQIYQQSIRHGNGKTREACWMKLLCLFAPLNKKNYRDEAFVHIVHFTTTWPLAVREMLRSNCSIAVKGRKHHNMAIDEYVESMVVKPMKEYAKKHTTLSMLQKINMNLELFKHVRRIYMKGFELNKATSRSKPDSLPDRLKICWFAMKEKWFDNLERRNVNKYAHNTKTVGVSSDSIDIVENKFLDVISKGKKYIRENYKELLLRLFPNTDYVEQ